MQNKNILLKQLSEDINNLPQNIKNTIEDNTLTDEDKIIIIAENIIDNMKQYLVDYQI